MNAPWGSPAQAPSSPCVEASCSPWRWRWRSPPARARRWAESAWRLVGFLEELRVGGGVHQLVGLGGIRQLHLDHPAFPVGVLVDLLRVLGHRRVDLGHLARERGVDVGDGL